jgi:hypothetical protein
MDAFAVLLIVGMARKVVRPGGEDEVRLLAKPHRVPDLKIDIGTLVGQVGDDDLAPFDEMDDLAFEEVALVVAIDAARLETGCLEGGKDHLVVDAIEIVVPDLHDDKTLWHGSPFQQASYSGE